MYQTVTQGIKVCVNPSYLDSESDPDEQHFVWKYEVEITNLTPQPVQLLSRYWRIIDADGRVQEVQGQGVVGQQPVIEPGAIFHYASGCPLTTDSGFMQGHYEMTSDKDGPFLVDIPLFSLDLPDSGRTLN